MAEAWPAPGSPEGKWGVQMILAAKNDHVTCLELVNACAVLGTASGSVMVADALQRRIERHRVATEPIQSLALLNGGKEAAVCLRSGAVLAFNLSTGHLRATLLRCHGEGAPPVLKVVACGSQLATVSISKVVLWDLEGWAPRAEISPPAGTFFTSMRAHRDSAGRDCLLGVLSDDTVGLWRAVGGALEARFQVPSSEGEVGLCDADACPGFVVAGSGNGFVYFWNADTKALSFVVEMPEGAGLVTQVAVIGQSMRVLVLCNDGRLMVISNPLSGTCTVLSDFSLGPCSSSASLFNVSACGTYMMAVERLSTARLYDLRITSTWTQALREHIQALDPESSFDLYCRPPLPSSELAAEVPAAAFADAEAAAAARSRQPLKPRQPATAKFFSKKASLTAPPAKQLLPQLAHAPEAPGHIRRLQAFLAEHGRFPSRDRAVVWRFLLRLPENQTAFRQLLRLGPHPAFKSLEGRYPLRDSRLFRKLRLVLSALAHWSPVCGELEYLPALAFPFVSFFGTDDLVAFETTMAVLVHWQPHYLSSFPHPPIPVLRALGRALQAMDPRLAAHLHHIKAGPQRYAWPLLRSLFTQVLPRNEWLGLFDHIFAGGEEPRLLSLAALAFLSDHRVAILQLASAAELDTFLSTEQPVHLGSLLKSIRRLRANSRICVLVDDFSAAQLAEHEDEFPVLQWPLAQGAQYPPMLRVPTHAVDFHLEERKRIEEEEALRRKATLLDSAVGRVSQMLAKERTVGGADSHAEQLHKDLQASISSMKDQERTRHLEKLEYIQNLERRAASEGLLAASLKSHITPARPPPPPDRGEARGRLGDEQDQLVYTPDSEGTDYEPHPPLSRDLPDAAVDEQYYSDESSGDDEDSTVFSQVRQYLRAHYPPAESKEHGGE